MLNSLLLVLAGLVLYRMWSRAARFSPTARLIVTLGLIGRALAGVSLFWISYLRLPFAKSFQMGDGFWFFALDGKMYFSGAVEAAHHGLGAIIMYNRTAPSVFFIQTLAVFALLFGTVASVAILLNVFCFLATALVILHWAVAETGEAGALALVPLAAVAFSPAVILWSMQPLKDPLFALLIVAVAASFAAWQRRWRSPDPAGGWRLAENAITLWVLLWALAAIRWYFAFVVWLTTFVLSATLCVLVKERRKQCIVINLMLFAVLSQAFLYGGGPYVPDQITRALSPRRGSLTQLTELPGGMLHDVDESRKTFDRVGGATLIGVADIEGSGESPVVLPQSPLQRVGAGLVAIVLPKTVAQRLHLIDIRGGRGMWLFVDVDTMAFDIVLVLATLAIFRAVRSGSIKEPLFWQLAITTVVIAAPIIYAISNFGTLFRHRGMIYIGLALIPLSLAQTARRTATGDDRDDSSQTLAERSGAPAS